MQYIQYVHMNAHWSVAYLSEYVILSGRSARRIISFWKELLFFQSCGSLSFSGQLDSTIFLQRFGELSMSLSSPLKCSKVETVYNQTTDIVRLYMQWEQYVYNLLAIETKQNMMFQRAISHTLTT